MSDVKFAEPIEETCPHCGNKVELEKGFQECLECGNKILCCNACEKQYDGCDWDESGEGECFVLAGSVE